MEVEDVVIDQIIDIRGGKKMTTWKVRIFSVICKDPVR